MVTSGRDAGAGDGGRLAGTSEVKRPETRVRVLKEAYMTPVGTHN